MRVSEVITILDCLRSEYGDVEVMCCEGRKPIIHYWDIESVIKVGLAGKPNVHIGILGVIPE